MAVEVSETVEKPRPVVFYVKTGVVSHRLFIGVEENYPEAIGKSPGRVGRDDSFELSLGGRVEDECFQVAAVHFSTRVVSLFPLTSKCPTLSFSFVVIFFLGLVEIGEKNRKK